MRCASSLPSSTPHWSNELIDQTAPWTKTMCSYNATRAPSDLGREALRHQHVRRAVALEHPVGHEPLGGSLGRDLGGRLAESERLGLREDVRDEQVVVPPERIEAVREADEVARNQPRPLVDQLVEAVLAVRARLAPVDRARLDVDRRRVDAHALAVRLHRQLLEVGGEALEVLVVREHGGGLGAEEVRVPDPEQPHQHGQVLGAEGPCGSARPSRGSRRGARSKPLRADGEHRREPDRRVHRVAPADPVPEPERVRRVDPERCDALEIRRDGDEMAGDRRLVSAEPVEQPSPRGVRVRHRLERRERLRADDEQRLGRDRGRASPRRSRCRRRSRRTGRSRPRWL